MFENSIDQNLHHHQQENTNIYSFHDFLLTKNKVYCPMCEHIHENNTNCQRGF